MCSWCWGFRPVWQTLKTQLTTLIKVEHILGGLAPDSDNIMPLSMQHTLQTTWRTIQQSIPGIQFNFDFWSQCTPRRSTHLSCRAVIAAKQQKITHEDEMILAIQQAYYLNAQNPSDESTLVACAESIGLDKVTFIQQLHSDETQQQLNKEIQFSETIGATGYPSLILTTAEGYHSIILDYNNVSSMLKQIRYLTSIQQ